MIVFDSGKSVAILIAYEREADDHLYKNNSIYISELAVAKNSQQKGIAKKLIKIFIENNKFLQLTGDLNFTIQTNSSDQNKHVVSLYKSFGFKEVGKKEYDNRTDVVLRLSAE